MAELRLLLDIQILNAFQDPPMAKIYPIAMTSGGAHVDDRLTKWTSLRYYMQAYYILLIDCPVHKVDSADFCFSPSLSTTVDREGATASD